LILEDKSRAKAPESRNDAVNRRALQIIEGGRR
jgi:hypothetical protein